ncbi:MAG: hypothetical protein J0L92_12750 [Deltaproteobacteria bacterium]|nr:hypothetical protein [Deltaproteobacteria bacterium]
MPSHQRLDRCALDLLGRIEWPPRSQRSVHTASRLSFETTRRHLVPKNGGAGGEQRSKGDFGLVGFAVVWNAATWLSVALVVAQLARDVGVLAVMLVLGELCFAALFVLLGFPVASFRLSNASRRARRGSSLRASESGTRSPMRLGATCAGTDRRGSVVWAPVFVHGGAKLAAA